MLKTVIIDDEARARKTISKIISQYCPNVTILAEADSVAAGIKTIQQHEPDLIFLDIKLPDGTGFDLLKKINLPEIKVIFISAHEDFAVEAFKFSALDYILKPIDPKELIQAIDKADASIQKENISFKLTALTHNISSNSNSKIIVVKTSNDYHLIPIQNIVRCEADRNYTYIWQSDGKSLLVSKTLKEFEDLLSGYGFFRIHQSHLVNISYISRCERKRGGQVIMKDKTILPVALQRKALLVELLENI